MMLVVETIIDESHNNQIFIFQPKCPSQKKLVSGAIWHFPCQQQLVSGWRSEILSVKEKPGSVCDDTH